ncbi:TetR/AcrR family transcriptional regulator [Microbulbifer agarilyticus]
MPTQARAQETVKRILSGARQILREQGEDAMTTRNIADVSGVRTGSIYQYFPNRDSILYALYGQRMEDTVAALEGLFTNAHLELPLEEFLKVMNDTLREDLEWGRPEDVALNRAVGENSQIEVAVADTLNKLYRFLARLMRHYGCNWPEKELLQYAEFLYSLNHFGFALRIRQEGEKSQFTHYLVNDLQRYLLMNAVNNPLPDYRDS